MVRILMLLLCLLLNQTVSALEARAVLDRNMGLLLGDKIMMTIELPIDSSQLDKSSLPSHEQRFGHWLVVHDLNLDENTLTLLMQLVNVPAENRRVQTPELILRSNGGKFIHVPLLSMQIGSFLENTDEAEFWPKADVPLPEADYSDIYTLLWLSSSIFIVSSMIWLAWHFGLRPQQRLPFACLMFELNKMRLLGRKDCELASRFLHHAFNQSVGRVVIHSQLVKLWRQCPWLEPLKADIDRFYADSSAHFFSPKYTSSKDFEQILALAKACRAQERMA